jgi:hypothetical protein
MLSTVVLILAGGLMLVLVIKVATGGFVWSQTLGGPPMFEWKMTTLAGATSSTMSNCSRRARWRMWHRIKSNE